MDFETGKRYGSYEVIDVLESSRDGITYKVKNVLANRIEVLKVLPGSAQDDQDRLERFLREVRVHAALLHPNIVTFYNAMELERRIVMLSELVEGPTLAACLEAGPLPWLDAVRYMEQILSALDYAHAHGVVHRDLTPAKIILTPRGAVRLGGFGLAKGIADPHLTAVGTVVGTLKYISPEQVRGVQQLDRRTDIYAAGVVLYEMLAGRPPFDSKSQFEIMAAHVNRIPAPPSALQSGVPQALDGIVLKALAKDPAERFQTAEEFRQALQAAREGETQAAREPHAPARTNGNAAVLVWTDAVTGTVESVAPVVTAVPADLAHTNGTAGGTAAVAEAVAVAAAPAADTAQAVAVAPAADAAHAVEAAPAPTEAGLRVDTAPEAATGAAPRNAIATEVIAAGEPVFSTAAPREGIPRELMLAGVLVFLIGVIAFFVLR